MRPLNIALLAAFALHASAVTEAATCKFETGPIDRFTNVNSTSTKWNSLTSTMGNMFGKAPEGLHEVKAAAVSAWFKGDSAYLAVRINLEDHISMEPPPYELEGSISIPGDSRLLILMDDGAILELPTERAARFDATFVPPGVASNTGFRKTDNNDYVKSTEATINYLLDESTTAALRAQDATNMRVEAGDTYYDIDIHKKSTGDVAAMLDCIQQARDNNGVAE